MPFIPICYGYNEDWAVRVGRGQDAMETLECKYPGGLFYVSDVKKPGMQVISVGTAGDPHSKEWRSNLVQLENADGSGWTQDLTFYAYTKQMDGTVPVAVGHAEYKPYGWKYRCDIGTENAGDKGWTHSFVFYAPIVNPETLIPVNVCTNEEKWTYKVKEGINCEDETWKYRLTFQGLTEPRNGTMPISVGYAGENETFRSRVTKGDHAGSQGWTHDFTVNVFKEEQPGTIPIAVGHATFSDIGWKYRVVKGKNGGGNGWTHDFFAYVFPIETVELCVGYESTNWFTLVREGEITGAPGYNPAFSFHGLKAIAPDAKAISVGEAGQPGNQLRGRVIPGESTGGQGWTHKFTFYAFDEERACTIPYGVGHTKFPNGWKYRVVENNSSGGGSGWTHDFTFYAYNK